MRRMALLTLLIFLALPCLAYTIVTARPSEDLVVNYSNRIVLIRHAEKGFASSSSEPQGSDGPTSEHKHDTRHGPGRGRAHRPPARSFWSRWVGPAERGPPSGRHLKDQHGPPRHGRGVRKFPNGLSEIGKERAQYLRELFGSDSEWNFGKIFAAPREQDMKKEDERTYATVAPLAQDLGLDIDISCAMSEPSCIAKAISDFAQTSDQDILISWKHFDLNKIAAALGAKNARAIYPDDRNDVIWIMHQGSIVQKRSMHCPGLDDGRVDVGDPDLEVERPSSDYGVARVLTAVVNRLARIISL